jgi:hypothetical protein
LGLGLGLGFLGGDRFLPAQRSDVSD